ncbi:MAG: PEGA domain-containing protein [Vicinamibacterales bacterium]
MNAKIVAVPLLAAIWLGSPSKALAQDPDPVVLSAPAIKAEPPAAPRPRIAEPRIKKEITADTPAPPPDVGDDQRGRGRQGPGGGNRGGSPAGRPSGQRVVPPRAPSAPVYGYSYRRPYYPPAYYDRWAFRTYRWSPLSYVPWSWIYGTAGYASFGYNYGGGYGYGPAYPSYGPGLYGMYPPYGGSTTFDTGELRLRIRPRDAQVFVDGFFAGTVDDFDGNFQSLRLEQGGHKIEVRMPGFQTLTIDVHIQPKRTLTIREDLQPSP